MNSDQSAVTTEPANDDLVLNALKQRADALGVEYGAKIGIVKLTKRINEHLETQSQVAYVPGPSPMHSTPHTNQEQLIKQNREKRRKEQLKLVRVIIGTLDPGKKEWEGEIVTVSNDLVGTQKKYVPYNHEAGWHIPQIMLNMLREKKCQTFTSSVNKTTGVRVHKAKTGSAYSIEVLPPLTPTEIEKLAKLQTHNLDED